MFGLCVIAAAVCVGTVGCGEEHQGTYTGAEVLGAFDRAGFPVEESPCSPPNDLLGATTCFTAAGANLSDLQKSHFWMNLVRTDQDGAAVDQNGGGPLDQANNLSKHLGNLVVSVDLAPPYVAAVRLALRLLRQEHRPTA